eukprot:Rhum_TRINITY_DN14690_c0_g3::Rhum_TRINITY_DN14690_c0_g3_i1::g.102441::m.102441
MSSEDVVPSEVERSRETKTRGPYEFIYKQVYGHYPRAACYNIRELYIQCILATDCVKEKRDFEACRREPSCNAERNGLHQCRLMNMSPASRLRGNRWDTRSPEEMRELLKHEKMKQRDRELGKELDDTHEVHQGLHAQTFADSQSSNDMAREARGSTRQSALQPKPSSPAPPV